jgi:hypothetical protein
VIIEVHEVPDEALDALLEAAPDSAAHPFKVSGLREEWRQALAAALTAWEKSRPAAAATYAHACGWLILAVQHRDALLGIKQTDVLQRCVGCGDVRSQVLTGTWTLEQLRT